MDLLDDQRGLQTRKSSSDLGRFATGPSTVSGAVGGECFHDGAEEEESTDHPPRMYDGVVGQVRHQPAEDKVLRSCVERRTHEDEDELGDEDVDALRLGHGYGAADETRDPDCGGL